MRVLLLNSNEKDVLGVIPWQKAVSLLVRGRVRSPQECEDKYEIRTTAGLFVLPAVLILVEYVSFPKRKVKATKKNIFKRDMHICQYCGKKVTDMTGTVDHVVPQSKKGLWEWTNLVTSCGKCNRQKDSRSLAEFEKSYGKKLRCKPFEPKYSVLVVSAIDLDTNKTWKKWVL